ncbi:flagellar motor protein [Conexibacter sp. W3-3-2]|uniref:flagellar motor protein n=1 Tax=Conexibacter sp. W3-3-2 TaxID=2675227 RepID=UPI0012B9DA83|nr:flagellar motor protein [Conexibacter sp. W3-3-2]MTD45464.1 flagellar motor protein [Conexibacter sp. W3-3-2]
MKAATAIGVLLAIVSLVVGGIMKGTQPMSLINPAAFVIIIPTVAGCTLAAVGMARFKLIPAMYKRAFSPPELNLAGSVTQLTGFAERARKDGLLALEEEIEGIEDEFTKTGMQLVVDGTDPDLLIEIMEADTRAMHARHKANAETFMKAGQFAPTIGVMGTVVGLVSVLGNLSAPETLGPSIATAFIATLYGIASANLIFLPVGTRLKVLSTEEVESRQLILEGIIAIQAGDNPRIVQQKLLSFLAPAERAEVGEGGGKPNLTAVEGGAAQAA